MSFLKRVFSFLCSMRFAIMLLLLLAIACILGSAIPQQLTYDGYAARYSERAAMLIFVLFLDNVFHSWWFVSLTALLSVNLLLCNIFRMRSIARRIKADMDINATMLETAAVELENVNDIDSIFTRMRIKKQSKKALMNDGEAVLGCKNRIGHAGAWLCHLGMLLLILGFALGQMTASQYTVAGFSGDTVTIETETEDIAVRIEDFDVAYNADGAPKQYTTCISVTRGSETLNGASSVNHPAKLFGFLFSQNSYGYAAEAQILQAGNHLQTQILFPGDRFQLNDRRDISVVLDQLSATDGEFVYSCYFMGGYMGSREGIAIKQDETQSLTDEYSISFCLRPYTVIVARRDVFRVPTFIGAITVLAGLLLSFYVRPRKLLAVLQPNGLYTLRGYARKGDTVFLNKLSKTFKEGDEDNV